MSRANSEAASSGQPTRPRPGDPSETSFPPQRPGFRHQRGRPRSLCRHVRRHFPVPPRFKDVPDGSLYWNAIDAAAMNGVSAGWGWSVLPGGAQHTRPDRAHAAPRDGDGDVRPAGGDRHGLRGRAIDLLRGRVDRGARPSRDRRGLRIGGLLPIRAHDSRGSRGDASPRRSTGRTTSRRPRRAPSSWMCRRTPSRLPGSRSSPPRGSPRAAAAPISAQTRPSFAPRRSR